MATANSRSKSARIETRVSLKQKNLIERDAAVGGRTVSEFALAHVEVATKKVIDEHEKLYLQQSQSKILVEALSAPKKLNRKLKLAVEGHRKPVARDVDRLGVGSLILSDAITRCVRVASEIAASLLVVDFKGEAATLFYEKLGLTKLPRSPDRMFLPMQTAEMP